MGDWKGDGQRLSIVDYRAERVECTLFEVFIFYKDLKEFYKPVVNRFKLDGKFVECM